MDVYEIGERGTARIEYPHWFRQSFLDLRDDLAEAGESGKRGVILMLSQSNCSHCQAFLDTTLSDPATVRRVQAHYDVVALDIFSDLELTNIDGSVSTVKDFAETVSARLTPTLIFLGTEGRALLKVIGFYPPETFEHVLDYIDGAHYERSTLSSYIQAQATDSEQQEVALDDGVFEKSPIELTPSDTEAARKLIVIFTQPSCPACERFHQRVLSDSMVRTLFSRYRSVVLDATDDQSTVVTPNGRRTTPRQWRQELELVYDVATVFFDERGQEVHRLDAETSVDRMTGSLEYVLANAYEQHAQFLQWRKERTAERRQERQPQ